MVDPSFSSQLLTDFGGSWPLLDSPDIPLKQALLSENMSFTRGQCSTRYGFGIAYVAGDAISALFNWISSLGNNLVWYRTSDNSVQIIDIAAPSAATVIPGDLLGYAATFANAGARLYCAFFLATGLGASGARVISFQSAAYVNDLCFSPPLTYTPGAPTEPSAGSITQGIHQFGYRIEYRSGFLTRPSPDSGVGTPSVSTFTPVVFTAAGAKNLSWTLNTLWPAGAINVYMMMTTVSNPNQWFFVPGAVQAVVGGTTMAITFTIDISDDELFATGRDVTDSLLLLTNTTADVPPFFPSVVGTHGDRMFYVTTVSDNVGNPSGAVYMSNKNAYQEISADLSLIQLPGLKDIVTAISLDGAFYLFGPQWTYRTTDNGSAPVTWAAPALVDGRRGTLAVRGAEVSPSGIYAWIACQDGLYYFNGYYGGSPGVASALPISYYQQPYWDRINWDVANTLVIKDDTGVHKVYVMVALDGATTPNFLLTWDYTNGFGPNEANFSIDNIRNYGPGAMDVVLNSLPGTATGVVKRREIWLGSSTAGDIIRRNATGDPLPYRDIGQPIASCWESSLFPHQGESRGEVYQHHGLDTRLKGSGVVTMTAYELDHSQSFDILDVALSTSPGEIPHRGIDLISEGVSYKFCNDTNLIVDANFEETAAC